MSTQTPLISDSSLSPPTFSSDPSTLFHTLHAYPFSDDPAFQRGLTSILRSKPNAPASELSALVTRAQCFYYARKYNINIDVGAYEAWKLRQDAQGQKREGAVETAQVGEDASTSDRGGINGANHSSGVNGMSSPRANGAGGNVETMAPDENGEGTKSDAAAPYPVTFNEIVELITSGKSIPGIKEIPDIVLEGQESRQITTARRKPWERLPAG